MDKILPTEIISQICENICRQDIPSVRLSSKCLCDLATPFLLHEIHLVFKPDSFKRLLDISRHPVICRHITSLLYEPDILDAFETKALWERQIISRSYLDHLQKLPRYGANEEEYRHSREREAVYYKQSSRRNVKEQYSERDLRRAWKSYHELYMQQESLHASGYGFETICTAMRNLPNLDTVTMSLGSAPRTRYLDMKFRASLQRAGPDDSGLENMGVPQTRSLLLGASRARLSLDSVRLGSVDWKFLQATDSHFAEMKDTLRNVRYFEIHIDTGGDESEEQNGLEILKCCENLRDYRLWNLIRDSSLLKELTVAFDWYQPTCPGELEWVVGDTRWESLTAVNFQCIDTDERSWVDFYGRHKNTLKEVHLETIRFKSGGWPSALESMHNALSLTSAHVTGHLLGDDPLQFWYLYPPHPTLQDDLSFQNNRTRKALEEYLTGEGDCPLRDEVAHPMVY